MYPTGAKKNELCPWRKQQWCIPAEASEAFVTNMEDVLDLYARPEDPRRPVVCVDETSQQHLQEMRPPLPVMPGKPYRYDPEYKRNDFAHVCQDIVDVHFPDAEKILIVCDNLNTHKPGSLYKAFEAQEAERIAEKLEFHYTPKHGSWLNIAEIEFSVLRRQCLSRRIPDQETLKREVQAWQNRRNQQGTTVHWRFTTDDARIKLKKLYPSSND